MIVILCKSYESSCAAFDQFMEFLEDNEPWAIKRVFKHTNCVETDDDLRYIFMDNRFVGVFNHMLVDIVDVKKFFRGINDFYYYDEVIEYDRF